MVVRNYNHGDYLPRFGLAGKGDLRRNPQALIAAHADKEEDLLPQ
ncbi:MAG: hypothetical protein ACM3SP_04785 [Chloroflexota bacterium]